LRLLLEFSVKQVKAVEQNHRAPARFADNSSIAGETLALDHAARQPAEPAKR